MRSLILFCATTLCILGGATSFKPFIEKPGKTKILVFIDLHTEVNGRGQCELVNTQAVEMVHSMVWAYERLSTLGHILPDVGLTVYDMCGSVARATTIMYDVTQSCDLTIRSKLGAVISHVNSDVARIVRDIIDVTGYVHVRMTLKPYWNNKLQNAEMRMSVVSWNSMQALVAAIEPLRWNYISTLSLANSTSSNEQDMFEKIARDHGVCISESIKLNDPKQMPPNFRSTAVIVFSSGMTDAQLTEVLSSFNQSTNCAIVWNRKTIFLPVNNDTESHAVLSIADSLPPFDELKEYFNVLLNIEMDGPTQRYFTEKEYCLENTGAVVNSQCVRNFSKPFSLSVSNWHVHTSLSAMLLVQDSFKWFDRSLCNVASTFTECEKNRGTTTDTIRGDFGRLPLKSGYNATVLVKFGEVVETRRPLLVTAYLLGDTKLPIGLVENNTFFLTNETSWAEVEGHIPPSVCPGYCPECMAVHCACSPKRTEPAIVSPGEIIIAGTFPIHHSAATGVKCGDISTEGLMAAEAFVWAVETFKARFSINAPFDSTSVGAVVFDTCSDSPRHERLINDYRGCILKPKTKKKKNKLDSSSVLAHLRFTKNGHFGHTGQTAVFPKISISQSGVNVGDNFKGDYFIAAIKNVLLAVNWRRVTVIHSTNVFDSTFSNNFDYAMRTAGVEILYKLVYSSFISQTERENRRRFILDISKESRAVLVLTNTRDTALLMSDLSAIQSVTGTLDFLFMPWHAEVVAGVKGNLTRGSLLLKTQRIENDRFGDYWSELSTQRNDKNPWWRQYQETRHSCTFENYVTENPDSCDDKLMLQRSLSVYVIKVTDIMLLTLAKLHQQVCSGVKGRCDALNDAANVTQEFKEAVTTYSSVIPGGRSLQIHSNGETLLPMTLVNIQQGSLPAWIGTIGPKGDLSSFSKHLIKSYTPKGRIREPNELNEKSLWCPRCYQCSKAIKVEENYFYVPGDVIVVGIFPLHKSSSNTFACGHISPNGYVAAEAFKYATRTVKLRYGKRYRNAMLPGIRVGALILDSCSSVENVVSKILNFESCKETYYSASDPYAWTASPRTVVGYVAEGSVEIMETLSQIMRNLNRTLVTPVGSKYFDGMSHPNMLTTASTNERQAEAVIAFLRHHNWTNVAVVCSKEYQDETNDFSNAAGMRNVCLSDIYYLETLSFATVGSVVSRIETDKRSRVILTLLNDEDSLEFFDIVEKRMINRIWINIGSHNWITIARRVAKGTIFVDKVEGYHHGFYDAYFSNRIKEESSPLPWQSEVLNHRKWCNQMVSGDLYEKHCLGVEADYLRLRAKSKDIHRLIEAVDSLLHGFNKVYEALCPDGRNICREFVESSPEDVSQMIYKSAKTTTFTSEKHVIRFRKDGRAEDMGKYIFQTFEPKQEYRIGKPQFNKVSDWYDGKLTMQQTSRLVIYDLNGYPYKVVRFSQYTNDSHCINFEPSRMDYDMPPDVTKLRVHEATSPATFIPEIWVLVLLSAVGFGCMVAFLMLLFVFGKLCAGTLKTSNVWFGMLLLFGIMLLYLSCLPFFFTPSRMVCGMRHLAPSVAYAFCFSIMLVKLTNLREYSHASNDVVIHASRLNNCIFTLLITGVQIALSVQWWVLKSPLVEVNLSGTCSCYFDVTEFVTSQVYNMFLLFLCAIYSPSVCRARVNLGEGRLICAFSWLACAVWLGWVQACFLAPREFAEPAITVGVVLCASLMIVVIFIPKLTRISHIGYDLRHLHSNLPDNRSTMSGATDRHGFHDNGIHTSGLSYIGKDEWVSMADTQTVDKKNHKPLQRMNGEGLDCYY